MIHTVGQINAQRHLSSGDILYILEEYDFSIS